MRGVAYSPDFKALLMGLHQRGESLSSLSRQHHVARELLSRWWQHYLVGGLPALQPRSRRPHTSPTKMSARVVRRVLRLRSERRSAACGDGGAGPLAPARPATTPARPPVIVGPGPVSFITVSGVVTEATTAGAAPLAGVYVEVCGYDDAVTDEDGSYRLTSVPSNTPSVFAQKAGYEAMSVGFTSQSGVRLDFQMKRK